MPDNPPKQKDFFQKVVQWIEDAVDWVQHNLDDPALTTALEEDLGLNAQANAQPPDQPAPAKAKIDEYLKKADPDKTEFEETIQEVIAVVQGIQNFADAVKAEGMSAWDVVYLIGRVAASDSVRVRLPAAYAIAKLLLLVSDDPDSVEMLDPGKLATILQGKPLPAGSGEVLAQRISAGIGLLLLIAEAVVDKLTNHEGYVDALYGWDPDPDSTSPTADLISERAATILTTFPGTPATTLALTALGVPAEHGGPGLFFALGGSLEIKPVVGRAEIDVRVGATSALWMFVPFGDATQSFRAGGDPSAFLHVDAHPAQSGGEPVLRAGNAGGTRFEIGAFGFGIDLTGESAGVRLAFIDGKVVINLADGDGFVKQLPGGSIEIPFAIGLTVDTVHGLRFDGGTLLKVNLPVAASLFGVFTIQYLELALGPSPAHGLGLELSGGFSLNLGPFRASVDRIGLLADTGKLDGGKLENLGSMLGFKPPNGIGLLIDAGVVKGGGYLFIDAQRGEYAGALELAISLPVAGKISVKAIALISTKKPDGTDGWALLILLFVQFRIQLSWGFTLNGLGGMIGLHHGTDVNALKEGMKTGVLDDVLFPEDPVGDAPRIINRLRVVFPYVEGALTLGPAIEIGWGTPTIIDVKLGLLFEIDHALGGGPVSLSKIVLLGQLLVQLPPKDTQVPPVLKLLVDVVGWYDCDEEWLFIDARLRDSFIGVGSIKLNISGELLISMQFGDDPSFVLSAGGFHPQFKDLPKNVPAKLDRLGVSFAIGPLHVKVEAYFALTSNSVQTGLSIEVGASLGPVDIKGWIGFDALFVFEPTFHFIVEVRFGVSVKFKSFNLCGIDVRMSLEGPGLWHAIGHASFSILFWDVPIDFDESWGSTPPTPVETTNAAQALVEAVNKADNWSAQLPTGTDQLVTLAAAEGATGVVAHPLGQLQFIQRIVPFGLDIVRIGERHVDGANHFELGEVKVGGATVANPRQLTEHFARAQFVDRSDEEKLNDQSFERFPAGVAFGTSDYTASASVSTKTLDYEQHYLEPESELHFKLVRTATVATLAHELAVEQATFGSVARSARSVSQRLTGDGTQKISVEPGPPLVVADATRLTAMETALVGAAATNKSLAQQVVSAAPGAVLVEAYELGGEL